MFDFKKNFNRPLKKEDSSLFNPKVAKKKDYERETLENLHNPDYDSDQEISDASPEPAPKARIPARRSQKPTQNSTRKIVVKNPKFKQAGSPVQEVHNKDEDYLNGSLQIVDEEEEAQASPTPAPTIPTRGRKRKQPIASKTRKAKNLKTKVQKKDEEFSNEFDDEELGIDLGEEEEDNVQPTADFTVGQDILCSSAGFYYEAKITKISDDEGQTFLWIHYKGWNKRFDEKILEADAPDHFLPYTPANVKKCKAEIVAAQKKEASRKKK